MTMSNLYEILDKIGNGAFGEVYRAKHTATGEIVAIKKLRVNDDGKLDVLPACLFQEIETLRQVEHRNIVKLLDVFADGTHIALVMEYVDTDLFTVLRHKTKPFEDSEIRCLMRMLLQSIAYCHDHHIIHRDIKPGNLLLTQQGQLKLSDFGLATVYVGPQKSYSHQVSTRWYRAPELLLGSRHYDPSIDIWSIGVIFAELLDAVPIFPGQNDIEQLSRIFQLLGHPDASWPQVVDLPDFSKVEFPHYNAIPLQHVFPDAPPLAVDLLSKLLVLNPQERLTAAQALTHPYFITGTILSTFHPSEYEPKEDGFILSLAKPLL